LTSQKIAWVGTGGSSGITLNAIEDRIAEIRGDVGFTFIDTQPFNLRTGGLTTYRGRGKIRLASRGGCGMRSWTRSWSANMLLNGGPRMYRKLVRYCEELLSMGPDVLVMCHDRIYVETAMIAAARRMCVPTVLIQEGPFCNIGDGQAQSHALQLKAAIAPVVTAAGLLPPIPKYGCAGHDLLIAASESYRDRWIAVGVPEDRIRVCGIPRYDSLARARTLAGGALPKGERLRILYVVQPFAAHGKVDRGAAKSVLEMMAVALNQAAELFPIELIVRSHPRSNGDDIAALRQGLKIPLTDDRGGRSIEEAIVGADVIVGHYSSAILETLMIGKGAICIPIPKAAFAEAAEAEKQIWLTRIGLPVVTNAAELERALAEARQRSLPPINWDLIRDELGIVDGEATSRCAEAILKLVE